MKKQILFLAIFTLAVFLAGTNKVAAQVKPYIVVPTAAPACIPPEALAGCTADQLHPVQGANYIYTVNTTAATDVVRWFVVDNTAMETAGDSLISALTGILPAANGAIDDGTGNDPYLLSVVNGTYDGTGAAAAGSTSSIELQWKYFDGITNEVLLVAYVETSPGCTNNIAVFRIIPTPAFTIDIASVDAAGLNPAGPGDTPNEECVSPIESAVYNGENVTPGTATTLTVDYGENWVYFVVNGANYIDSWMPEFQIDYDDTAPDAVEASWAYLNDSDDPTATNWNTLTGSLGGTWTSAVPVIAGASAASAGTVGAGVVPVSGGECIVVRVRMDWGTDVEHDQNVGVLNFAANGVAYDGVGTVLTDFYDDRTNFEDLNNTPGAAVADACKPDGFVNDVVDYNITPRPQVEEGAPTQEIKSGQGVN